MCRFEPCSPSRAPVSLLGVAQIFHLGAAHLLVLAMHMVIAALPVTSQIVWAETGDDESGQVNSARAIEGRSVEPGWSPRDYDDQDMEELLFEAARNYDHVTSGGVFQPVTTSVRLNAGESAYFDGPVEWSRFYGKDWVKVEPWSYLSMTQVFSSAVGNWRRRSIAAAEWRDTHIARMILTDRRLLVFVEAVWRSLPHQSVAEFSPMPTNLCLVLTYHDDMPLRLRAPGIVSLSVMLASFLYPPEQMGQIPEFARFSATG